MVLLACPLISMPKAMYKRRHPGLPACHFEADGGRLVESTRTMTWRMAMMQVVPIQKAESACTLVVYGSGNQRCTDILFYRHRNWACFV